MKIVANACFLTALLSAASPVFGKRGAGGVRRLEPLEGECVLFDEVFAPSSAPSSAPTMEDGKGKGKGGKGKKGKGGKGKGLPFCECYFLRRENVATGMMVEKPITPVSGAESAGEAYGDRNRSDLPDTVNEGSLYVLYEDTTTGDVSLIVVLGDTDATDEVNGRGTVIIAGVGHQEADGLFDIDGSNVENNNDLYTFTGGITRYDYRHNRRLTDGFATQLTLEEIFCEQAECLADENGAGEVCVDIIQTTERPRDWDWIFRSDEGEEMETFLEADGDVNTYITQVCYGTCPGEGITSTKR